MGTSGFVSGYFLGLLAFVASCISYGFPTWLRHTQENETLGLLAYCINNTCYWMHEISWVKDHHVTESPEWYTSCRLLFGFGVGFGFVGTLMGALILCVFSPKNTVLTSFVTTMNCLAFCGVGVSTGIFGVNTHRSQSVSFSSDVWRYSWGFMVALGATGVAFVGPLVHVLCGLRDSNSETEDEEAKDEYALQDRATANPV